MNEPKDAILIVDDTPTNLDVLVNCLTESDFEVFVATDGQKALERVKLAKPDLIVLDVMMPGMDGFETCRRLKQDKDTKDIPVIFMTSLTDTVDKVKGFEVGAVDYVTKPIQHEEVLARVTTHLTIRKLHRELQQANERLEQRVAERTAELTQANDSLRESEARFSGILDIAPEAIISSDEFGHIIMFNKGAEAIFNYSQGEVIGKSIDLLIPEKYHKAHRSHIAKFVRSDQTTHRMGERGEVFGRRKNGEIFPAEASISKLQLDGQLILTEILRDITKRKEAEKALRDALSEIEQLKDRLQAENVYLQEEIKLEHNF
ncbi:MAG: response regulator, partial [bacterium]